MADTKKKTEEIVQDTSAAPAPIVVPEAPVEKAKKEETVPVPVDVLKEIRSKMDAQDAMLKKQEAELERLNYAADKGRLHRFDQRREEDIIRTARVATWIDENDVLQVVRGWQTETDKVFFDQEGVMHVDQKIKLLLGEGKTASEVVLSHLYWFQNMTSVAGDIVGEAIDKEKGTHLRTIRMKDGEEIVMDIRFINP